MSTLGFRHVVRRPELFRVVPSHPHHLAYRRCITLLSLLCIMPFPVVSSIPVPPCIALLYLVLSMPSRSFCIALVRPV